MTNVEHQDHATHPSGHQHAPDPDMDPTAFWEQHYGQRERVWSGRANAVLVSRVSGLAPGSVLDLGCGEGGDAIWLAGQGWRVTAVDISETALRRARAAAAAAGVSEAIELEQHDLGTDFPGGRFDLVSAQFLQSPVALANERILSQAAKAVAPGGRLLVVWHGAMPAWSTHPAPEGGFATVDDTWAATGAVDEDWVVEEQGTHERDATGPDGHSGVLVDNVILARRLR